MPFRLCLALLLIHLVSAADFAVRSDGTILKDGTPFFPHGFYSELGGYTEAAGLTELDTIAGGGFNFVQLKNNDIPNSPPNYPLFTLLNRCSTRGLWVVLGTTSGNITDGTQEAYVGQPAIMAWELSDDGDDGRWTLDQARARANTVKTLDPRRLSFLSLTGYYQSRRDAAAEWCGLTELAGLQVYPITPPPDYGVGADQVLAESYRRNVLYVDAALASGHAVVTTVQTFSWAVLGDVAVNPRYPTPAESRNMTYAAIAAGAKGLIGYSFRGLLTQPVLWDELKLQAAEVATLAPVLLDGTRTRLSTGNPWLAATTWRQGDQLTVAVLNLSTSAEQTVALAMPAGAHALQAMFPGRPSGLTMSGGNLSGSIGASTVHVYRLDLSAPANQSPTVTLSAPGSGTVGSVVSLSATAADSDGSIATVEFHVGTTLVGSDSSAPYAASWTPSVAGSYQVTAKATDNLGAITTSAASLVSIASDGLPNGWTTQDLGTVGLAGSTTESAGTWTLSGSGADIWNTADGCRFAYRQVTGDVQLTARVSGIGNTDTWAKAGVMVRNSLAAGSRHASTFVTTGNGVAYQRRRATNGASSHTAGPHVAAPYWLRIERIGSTVISSSSPDGTSWTEIRRENISMGMVVYVGLAVTSHNNGRLCTASFTNVQIVGAVAATN